MDMTAEAALTKLQWLLSVESDPDRVRTLLEHNLRGELTARDRRDPGSLREREFVDAVVEGIAASAEDGRAEGVAEVLFPVLMCHAAAAGDLQALDRMLRSGAVVTAADYDGRTPLHLAAAEGRREVLVSLLRQGADPTARDRWGRRPADDARLAGHAELEALLTEASEGS